MSKATVCADTDQQIDNKTVKAVTKRKLNLDILISPLQIFERFDACFYGRDAKMFQNEKHIFR
jgi:hypothetical protein